MTPAPAAAPPDPRAHLRALEHELAWFARVLDARLERHVGRDGAPDPLAIAPPRHAPDALYGKLVAHYALLPPERMVLCLGLAAHLRPHMLDVLFTRNAAIDREFTEFGGRCDPASRAFIPTGDTALFVVAGDDLAARVQCSAMFDPDHIFARDDILTLDDGSPHAPWSGVLQMEPEFVDLVTRGVMRKPRFGRAFPARELATPLEWDDLVLPAATLHQILEIRDWIRHGDALLYELELARNVKPGFRSLFWGPPGTGKTLTAALLGKVTGLSVYRVDLSLVISKYIGETEKNLEKVFRKAEHRNWILFFDEADALFGKRTQIHDAHDRFANQEVSFLLQRIEDYPGVVILASNLKNNLDEAFTRRFQSIVHFPVPGASERERLWRSAFSAKTALDAATNLGELASRHELTGGEITNVVRYATLRALSADRRTIAHADVVDGIRREFQKEGKTF